MCFNYKLEIVISLVISSCNEVWILFLWIRFLIVRFYAVNEILYNEVIADVF